MMHMKSRRGSIRYKDENCKIRQRGFKAIEAHIKDCMFKAINEPTLQFYCPNLKLAYWLSLVMRF